MRLLIGQAAPSFAIQDVDGREHTLEAYPNTPLLISFFRSAACPMCSLQVWAFAQHYERLRRQGLQVLTIFDSAEDVTREYIRQLELPLTVIADPQKMLFRLYGIESSWPKFVQGIPTYIRSVFQARRVGFKRWRPEVHAQLPADFLLSPDHAIAAISYGQYMTDRMPIGTIETTLERFGALQFSNQPTQPRKAQMRQSLAP